MVVVFVGVGGVLDADGDGERAAGADPAAVGSSGRVEAPGDRADDEHEGAARADQGPRVGTVMCNLLYLFSRHVVIPSYVLLRHLVNPPYVLLRHLFDLLYVLLVHPLDSRCTLRASTPQ